MPHAPRIPKKALKRLAPTPSRGIRKATSPVRKLEKAKPRRKPLTRRFFA